LAAPTPLNGKAFGGLGSVMNNFATFWQRFVAMWVDVLVFVPLMFLQAGIESISKVTALLVFLVYMSLTLAYPIYGHGRFGRTVGKWVMGIRVVRFTGGPLRWRDAWLRSVVDLCVAGFTVCGRVVALMAITDAEFYNVGWYARGGNLVAHEPASTKWVIWIGVVWFYSEVVTMLFNKRRRALHDFIAGTVVISDRFTGGGAAEQAVAADDRPRTAARR
jgi:uncharacterized RDD family membrane protein YckC